MEDWITVKSNVFQMEKYLFSSLSQCAGARAVRVNENETPSVKVKEFFPPKAGG
jgi:hypothetical protein